MLFFEPKMLYRSSVEGVPVGHAGLLPLGKARLVRNGGDVTLVGWGQQASTGSVHCGQSEMKNDKMLINASCHVFIVFHATHGDATCCNLSAAAAAALQLLLAPDMHARTRASRRTVRYSSMISNDAARASLPHLLFAGVGAARRRKPR